jgi:hypothetical protein
MSPAPRRGWRVWQRYMDLERFAFLDETGATTNMTRATALGMSSRQAPLVPTGPTNMRF